MFKAVGIRETLCVVKIHALKLRIQIVIKLRRVYGDI